MNNPKEDLKKLNKVSDLKSDLLNKKIVGANDGKNQLLKPEETPKLFNTISSEYVNGKLASVNSKTGKK